VDAFINETTRHANIILPPVSHLERDHYDLIFNNFAVRNVAKYSQPLFTPEKGSKEDWQILLDLASGFNSGPTAGPVKKRLTNWLTYQTIRWLKPKGVLNKMMTSGKSGLDIKTLEENPQGMDLGPLKPCMPTRLFHKSKRLSLTPDVYLQELDRVKDDLLSRTNPEFVLIGRRHIRSNNSWMHNNKRLIKGADRCTLMVHPEDAEKLSVQKGDAINIRSRVGTIQAPVEVTDELMPGVVSLPHGYGHNQQGVQLQQAQVKPGVNTNDLTDDMFIDQLTGNTALNGVPVELQRVG